MTKYDYLELFQVLALLICGAITYLAIVILKYGIPVAVACLVLRFFGVV